MDDAEKNAPERFDDIMTRLRSLVDRLEGGNLPLEDGLRALIDWRREHKREVDERRARVALAD